MMTKEKQLLQIENELDIDMAIDYIENNHKKDMNDYIRVLFLLMDFLVNGQCTENKHDFVADKTKKIFLEANSKYFHNQKYLFYIGFVASMSEWYFDIKWSEVEFMLKEAVCLEPKNLLYQWGYNSIIDQRIEVNTKIKYLLSKQILEDKTLIKNIRKNGLLGKYLEGFIQNEYELTKVLQ